MATTGKAAQRALREAEAADRFAGEDVSYHAGTRMSAALDAVQGWRLVLKPATGGGVLLGAWGIQNENTGRTLWL